MLKKRYFINKGRFKTVKITKDYKKYVFFTMLLCGVIFGVMLSAQGSDEWHDFFDSFVSTKLHKLISYGILKSFFSTFLTLFAILLFDYICGLCAVGTVFLYITPLLLGIYSGVISSQFYCLFGVTGIAYCFLVNVPCYAIAAATYIKCCCYSWDVSKSLFMFLINSKKEQKDSLLYDYTLKYLFMLIPIGVSALGNAVLSHLLVDFFGIG